MRFVIESKIRSLASAHSRSALLILYAVLLASCSTAAPAGDPIAVAFERRQSDVRVEGEGKVVRTLPDDNAGSRHQRFVVRLSSGQTVLIQHNTDVASRIDVLKAGDVVSFSGEYVWNEQGGLVHWTHHDPAGRHQAGWIKLNDRIYQ